MDWLTEKLLADAERHIAETERHIATQRDIIARLESSGLGNSETANNAREILRAMEASLRRHVDEQGRLRARMQR